MQTIKEMDILQLLTVNQSRIYIIYTGSQIEQRKYTDNISPFLPLTIPLNLFF